MQEEILIEWNPWWLREFKPDYAGRDILKRVGNWMERREILALTGSRRSGKTTVMYLLIEKLLGKLPKDNILFIKCDDERVEEEKIIEAAREKHQELFNPEGRVYLFLDEVQEIWNWERTVKRLYDLGQDIKIILTGSRLMKQELSSSLAGRFASFTIYPFSFREFLKCRGLSVGVGVERLSKTNEIRYQLREYLEWGGFPEVVLEGSKEMKKELLGFYSDSILYRDVVRRSGIRDVDRVERLKSYLLANVSNLLNYNRIAKHLGVAPDTVASYIRAMEDANFVFPVPAFSFSLKKQQINPKKVYCIDNGIRNSVGFRFSSDVGRLYENVVFLQLKRRYEEIYYWRNRDGEVDFLIKEGQDMVLAIQVCYDVEAAGEREHSSLLAALKEFGLAEGLVITGNMRDVREFGNRKIRYVPLWEWLLEE